MTSRKLMLEHAVAASAMPQPPESFSPLAVDRFQAETEGPEEEEEDSGRQKRKRPSAMKAPPPMKGAPAAGKKRYAEKTKNGHKFCVKWNTGGRTAKMQNCPKRELHACNVIIDNQGNYCGALGGRSRDHPNH